MEKYEMKKIFWTIAIIIVILLASAIFINKVKTGNAIREAEEQKTLESTFSDDCKCLASERIKCSSGFELKGGICKNETLKIFTNILKGCSEYKCSEGDYMFNSTTQKWEIKI